jgi:Fic family protein
MYIHEIKTFPKFTWNEKEILERLISVRNLQGRLMGRMESLGISLQLEASLLQETENVLKSSRIEGEILNEVLVHSSVSKQLGIHRAGLKTDRNMDSLVKMMLDATGNFSEKLTRTRIFHWHKLLFPNSLSGTRKIQVGKWRSLQSGPMQVVSGRIGKEKVHFEAPQARQVKKLMQDFLLWCNSTSMDPVLMAGIAHIWFLTIHPFEDGNGRIGRAISDLFLARSDETGKRFYSLSSAIEKKRKEYYHILELTQKGNLDISKWLLWFLDTLKEAILTSENTIQKVLLKNKLFHPPDESSISKLDLNPRQKKMLLKLIDGWEGKLTSSKWATATHCSVDTAGRDIQDLIQKGILLPSQEGGRSTHYILELK